MIWNWDLGKIQSEVKLKKETVDFLSWLVVQIHNIYELLLIFIEIKIIKYVLKNDLFFNHLSYFFMTKIDHLTD